jgi:hypothetical protein
MTMFRSSSGALTPAWLLASAAGLVLACSSGRGGGGAVPDDGLGPVVGNDGGASGDGSTVPVGPPEMIFSDALIIEVGAFAIDAQGVYVNRCSGNTQAACGRELIRIPKDGSGGATVIVQGHTQGCLDVYDGSHGANATGVFWGAVYSCGGNTVSVMPAGPRVSNARGNPWNLDQTQASFYSWEPGGDATYPDLSFTIFRAPAFPSVTMFKAPEPGCTGTSTTGEGSIGYYLSACPNRPAGKTTYNVFVLKAPLAAGVLPTPLSTWADDSGSAKLLVQGGAISIVVAGASGSKLLMVPPSGGPPKLVSTFAALASPESIRIAATSDAANVYVLDSGKDPYKAGMIYRLPFDGSGVYVVAKNRDSISSRAIVDESYLYWMEGASSLYGGSGVKVWRVGKGGGTLAK